MFLTYSSNIKYLILLSSESSPHDTFSLGLLPVFYRPFQPCNCWNQKIKKSHHLNVFFKNHQYFYCLHCLHFIIFFWLKVYILLSTVLKPLFSTAFSWCSLSPKRSSEYLSWVSSLSIYPKNCFNWIIQWKIRIRSSNQRKY